MALLKHTTHCPPSVNKSSIQCSYLIPINCTHLIPNRKSQTDWKFETTVSPLQYLHLLHRFQSSNSTSTVPTPPIQSKPTTNRYYRTPPPLPYLHLLHRFLERVEQAVVARLLRLLQIPLYVIYGQTFSSHHLPMIPPPPNHIVDRKSAILTVCVHSTTSQLVGLSKKRIITYSMPISTAPLPQYRGTNAPYRTIETRARNRRRRLLISHTEMTAHISSSN